VKYSDSLFDYHRRVSREVMVGRVGVGGSNPIRVQSMITCDTMDTEASIAQTIELANAGCEIVRITAPTVKDARNLEHIKRGLIERGCDVPIVADIHFKPDAAMEAAKWVEKVRINPGNYADSKKFNVREYSDEQYAAEIERIRERFAPLIRLCQERGIAIRIGTNHGSLSDRIMNRYGDTPLGMVESALEFARIARDLDYHALIFSMKSSNPKVMINAYRLLAARLNEEEVAQASSLRPPGDGKLEACATWNYPIHLGVTEAGEGEDARIKSAIGIGSLLADGIGDTIRVSLTEDSIHEIPVAQALARIAARKPETRESAPAVDPATISYDPFSYQRRASHTIARGGVRLGGEELIRVVIRKESFDKIAHKIDRLGDYKPEIVYEEAQISEVDPRDDAAIALLNEDQADQFVTIRDDVDLPVIAAYRLLASKLACRFRRLAGNSLAGCFGQDARRGGRDAHPTSESLSSDAAHGIHKHRFAPLRWNRRRDPCAGRRSAWAGVALELQHSPGRRLPHFQNGLRRLSELRAHLVQSPNHDRENQSGNRPP
jgi:(E)-4-hydroxy-3-methylbut-2-enyl-diphosphate synthase